MSTGPVPMFRMSTDARHAATAADLLNVREYHLFALARRRQLGRPAADRDVEPHFMHYLKSGEVPAWVATFSRDVIAKADAGDFDPQAFGGQSGERQAFRSPSALRRFEIGNVIVFAVASICCWLITQYAGI